MDARVDDTLQADTPPAPAVVARRGPPVLPRLWRGMKRAFGSGRGFALVMLLLFVVLRSFDPVALQYMRVRIFDLFQVMKPREIPPDYHRPVMIADIDERSLQEIGQWPWSRDILARLLDRLGQYGVALVAFDVVFAETDRTSPHRILATLGDVQPDIRAALQQLPDNDETFAAAIGRNRVVMGMGLVSDRVVAAANRDGPAAPVLTQWLFRQDDASRPDPVCGHDADGNRIERDPASLSDAAILVQNGLITTHRGLLRNTAVLDRAALGRGVFKVEGEVDGTVRRVPMIVVAGERCEERFYPALSTEVMRVATGMQMAFSRAQQTGQMPTPAELQDTVSRVPLRIRVDEITGVQEISTGRMFNPVKTDGEGRSWVYFSRLDHEKYISIADILNREPSQDLLQKLQGRIVLVGTSAVGLLDIKTTPLDPFLPGVEVHAQVLENIIDGNQLHRPSVAIVHETFATVAGGLLVIVLLPLIGARWSLLFSLTLVAGLFIGAWYMFAEEYILYDPVYPALVTILLYMYLTYVSYAREEAQRRQVREAFSRYMSPALVEKLAADPSQLKLGGEMREMSLLFCDVRGFTSISELFDAQGLTRLINRFLTPMTDVILERHGTIDKYMGDCIMAFWNAPLDDGEHARNALRAALAMKARLQPLNDALEQESIQEQRKHVPIKIGIGINSDTVCVGNMGSDQRFDYSVLGDGVNLASRLEGQSKTYGITTVIGEHTANLAKDFAILELDKIRVKGKTVPVRIFTICGEEDTAQSADFRRLKAAHDRLIAAYRAQDWAGAEAALAECRIDQDTFDMTGFYDLYAERLAEYEANPPGADWDGVFVATSK